MKQLYTTLSRLGYTSSGYIVDLLLVADSFQRSNKKAKDTVDFGSILGFIIYESKSVLIPTTRIMVFGEIGLILCL